jgi:hypothetical protein
MNAELWAKQSLGGVGSDPIRMNRHEIAVRASPKERGISAEAGTMRRLRAAKGEAQEEGNCG